MPNKTKKNTNQSVNLNLSRQLTEKETEEIEKLAHYIDDKLTTIFKVEVDFHLNMVIRENGRKDEFPAFILSNIPDVKKSIYILEHAIKAEKMKLIFNNSSGHFDA